LLDSLLQEGFLKKARGPVRPRAQQDGAVRPTAHLLHLPGPVPDA